jgi:hypothetical protein
MCGKRRALSKSGRQQNTRTRGGEKEKKEAEKNNGRKIGVVLSLRDQLNQ